MNPVLAEVIKGIITAIVQAIGIDGFKEILQGHPLTAGKIIEAERGAANKVVDAIEDAKFGPKAAKPPPMFPKK